MYLCESCNGIGVRPLCPVCARDEGFRDAIRKVRNYIDTHDYKGAYGAGEFEEWLDKVQEEGE